MIAGVIAGGCLAVCVAAAYGLGKLIRMWR